MAFKEKIAWLSLVGMVVFYGIYFALAVPLVRRGEATTLQLILLLGGVLTAQIIVLIIASIALALQSGRDAAARPDERDRAIARRGAAAAYYVLMVGMVVVGCVMPFRDQGWVIINTALFVLLVAEVTRYGLVVASYRRGWHG